MPLLLFLSALLSALTGVVSGVPSVDVQVSQQLAAAQVRGATTAAMPTVAGHAHLLGAFGEATGFASIGAIPVVRLALVRLYLDRPRA